MFGGFNLYNGPAMFNTQYRCFSVSMMAGNERDDVEKGGKIILPPSALDVLTRLNIVYPMMFKLRNHKKGRQTHAGVLEFVADEGKAYIPHWMMQNMILDEGDLVQIESASLPIATFAKFQPQSVDFLDISNPKAVLENVLRTFACLTKGDVLAIKYNDKVGELFHIYQSNSSFGGKTSECPHTRLRVFLNLYFVIIWWYFDAYRIDIIKHKKWSSFEQKVLQESLTFVVGLTLWICDGFFDINVGGDFF